MAGTGHLNYSTSNAVTTNYNYSGNSNNNNDNDNGSGSGSSNNINNSTNSGNNKNISQIDNPDRGRILILKAEKEGIDFKIRLVHQKEVLGCVYSALAFDEKLLVGIDGNVNIPLFNMCTYNSR